MGGGVAGGCSPVPDYGNLDEISVSEITLGDIDRGMGWPTGLVWCCVCACRITCQAPIKLPCTVPLIASQITYIVSTTSK
ncbi:hypothetical protein CRG98_006894 [Punica granatum]|uniref:Uncharacterized protein n=1 Tax=Punica granatum TaxID=22663 RepID=A0A2I0KW67_PUNGR|nr:hypothetical protein CRG98_006894 [Punica granatum]